MFDVETTGANPRVHQIVSIGAVLLDRATLDQLKSMSTLVQLVPEALAQADPKAMQIHRLMPSQLEAAPTPGEVVTLFLDSFGTDFYFCGWNVCFDTQFLRALFEQAGRLQDFNTFRYHRLDLWSLLELAWLRGVIPLPPESLSSVCRIFGIERQKVHDALEDALLSAQLLRKTLPMLVGRWNEENIEPFRAAAKSEDHMTTTSFDGNLNWRALFDGWRNVAHSGSRMHYAAQRRFSRRSTWLGACATLLTTLVGATAIKEISSVSQDSIVRWTIGAVAAIAAALTALHSFLGYAARAASHRSTAAGYATALRKIDEDVVFGYSSAGDAQKAADEIRVALNALSRDAPEVPADILNAYRTPSLSSPLPESAK